MRSWLTPRALSKLLVAAAVLLIFISPKRGWSDASQADVARVAAQAQDITGIEYVLAMPNGGPIYARWGHSLLRLVNPKIPTRDNLVISFLAKVQSDKVDYLKGLFGGYPMSIEVHTLSEIAFEYNHTYDQSLERFVIALKPTDIQVFVTKLQDWMNHPSKMGDYTFLSNNCAGALSRLFELAGITPEGTMIPEGISELLNESGVSPFPAVIMENDSTLWGPIASALGVSLQQINSIRSLTDAQIDAVFTKTGAFNIALLIYRDPILDEETKTRLRAVLQPHLNEVTLDDLFEIRDVPVALYHAPETSSDFAPINQARRGFFGRAGLLSDLGFIAATGRRSRRNAYEQLEMQRIESDPDFRKIPIRGDLGDLTGYSVFSLVVRGKSLVLIASPVDPSSPSIDFTLNANFTRHDDLIQLGDLSCPLRIESDMLDSDCRALLLDGPSNHLGVAIAGFRQR